MTTIKESYSWSFNEEYFHGPFDSKKECIQDASTEDGAEEGVPIYIGRNKVPILQISRWDVKTFLDDLVDHCEWPEVVADRFNDSLNKKEVLDKLTEDIRNLIANHDLFDGSFLVEDIEKHILCKEDLDETSKPT